MKKKYLLLILFSCLFLTVGCSSGDNNTKEITYTNKFECTREENFTVGQVYYITKKYSKNDDDSNKEAVKINYTRLYDFNDNGDKLLAYYDITTYNYVLDYDMEEQKNYFIEDCKNKDKNTYKNCIVKLEAKTITVTLEVDLNSDTSDEYLNTLTLKSVKENYLESPYTCK